MLLWGLGGVIFEEVLEWCLVPGTIPEAVNHWGSIPLFIYGQLVYAEPYASGLFPQKYTAEVQSPACIVL